ncbi:MAG: DUF4433 domain-containing protein [Candidatus Sumerlaeia bacterium]|nr:DUF4433 domain-containing protein [Candidatus Sumerlaeia bacterium]
MQPPIPTSIYRFFHIENLPIILARGGFHAPAITPRDGLAYRPIHNIDIQQTRRVRRIPCGPGGVIHDYVPFYFGPRSPMLLQLHTDRVPGYTEKQGPLVYAVTTVEAVTSASLGFVFSDGHGIAAFTKWFDDLSDLARVDWEAVSSTWWRDTPEDMDRQRRKQAEFLVHRFLPWDQVERIGVVDAVWRAQVEDVLGAHPAAMQRPVEVRPEWYY